MNAPWYIPVKYSKYWNMSEWVNTIQAHQDVDEGVVLLLPYGPNDWYIHSKDDHCWYACKAAHPKCLGLNIDILHWQFFPCQWQICSQADHAPGAAQTDWATSVETFRILLQRNIWRAWFSRYNDKLQYAFPGLLFYVFLSYFILQSRTLTNFRVSVRFLAGGGKNGVGSTHGI